MNKTYAEIWANGAALWNDYAGTDVPHFLPSDYYDKQSTAQDDFENEVYNVLYGYYANRPITAGDSGLLMWKSRFLSAIGMFAPAYMKKLELQTQLRNLSDDEVRESAKTITNVSAYPGDELASAGEELTAVDNQQRTAVIGGKLQAYGALEAALKQDPVSQFVRKFEKFFSPVCLEKEPE